MNSATFLSAIRASGAGLISDSSSRSSAVAFSWASCAARRSWRSFSVNTAAATWPRAT